MRAHPGRHAHRAVSPPVRCGVRPRCHVMPHERGGPAPGHAHGLRPLATGRGGALFAPDHVRQTFDARTDHGGLASKPTLLPFEHSVTPTESPNSASRAAAWVS